MATSSRKGARLPKIEAQKRTQRFLHKVLGYAREAWANTSSNNAFPYYFSFYNKVFTGCVNVSVNAIASFKGLLESIKSACGKIEFNATLVRPMVGSMDGLRLHSDGCLNSTSQVG